MRSVTSSVKALEEREVPSWLRRARSRIGIVKRAIYFDNAGAGPLSSDVRRAAIEFLELWDREGEPWDVALEHIVEARALFAKFVGATKDQVAAVPNVSTGLNALLSSLELKGEANAVASPLNFPTGIFALHALRQRGLLREVRLAQPRGGAVGLEEYERLIDDQTRIVLVDYVSWITGFREHIRELAGLAHAHGARLIVDAFHLVGVMPLDVARDGIDALLCGAYKWLLGLHGAAFVYLARELLEGLRPMLAGWHSIADSVIDRMARREEVFARPFDISDYKRAEDAKVLEWGTWPAIAFEGTLAALKMLEAFEVPQRYDGHTYRLTEELLEGLEGLGLRVLTPRERRAAIVCFEFRDSHVLARRLRERGIIVSARPGLIRVSPHFYNTEQEIHAFLEVLAQELKSLRQ